MLMHIAHPLSRAAYLIMVPYNINYGSVHNIRWKTLQ